MAKVTNPLFGDFREAFADLIVYQNNGSSTPIARIKVKHPQDPRSAHYPPRIPGWHKAIEKHQQDAAPPEDTIRYVAKYALAPTRPSHVTTLACTEHETDPDLVSFTIAWRAPTTKYRGHILENLVGYFIEITQNFVHWQRLNKQPITQTQFTGAAPQGDIWIIVLAVDDQNNVSTPSPTIKLGDAETRPIFELAPFDLAFYAEQEP